MLYSCSGLCAFLNLSSWGARTNGGARGRLQRYASKSSPFLQRDYLTAVSNFCSSWDTTWTLGSRTSRYLERRRHHLHSVSIHLIFWNNDVCWCNEHYILLLCTAGWAATSRSMRPTSRTATATSSNVATTSSPLCGTASQATQKYIYRNFLTLRCLINQLHRNPS